MCVFDHFEPFLLFDIFKVLRHYLTYMTIFARCQVFFLKWGQNDFDLSLSFLQVCKNDVQILRFVTNLVLIYVANLVLNFSTNFELNFISNRTAIG